MKALAENNNERSHRRETANEEEQSYDRQRRFLFAVHGAPAKAEREETSLTTLNFSARGGRCQFLSRFVFYVIYVISSRFFGAPRPFLLTFCTKSLTLRPRMYRTSIGEKA